MAQEIINIGVIADDGTGDTIRNAGRKINANFTELYAFPIVTADIKFEQNNIVSKSSNADIDIDPAGSGSVVFPAISIDDNNIKTTRTNDDLKIVPSGSGKVVIDGIGIGGTSISATDSTLVNINENVLVQGSLETTFTMTSLQTFQSTVQVDSTLDVSSLTQLSTLTVSGASSFVGTTTIDNLTFNDNIIGTSSNANLELTPGGTGVVNVSNLTIDSSINLTDNVIQVTRSDDDFVLSASGTGSVQISKVDMNDGTVDNVVIGGTTPAAGTFTSLTFTNTSFDADGVTITDNTIKANRSNDNLEFAASGSGKVTINEFSLPASDGTTGQILRTDGSKSLTFVTSPILLGESDIQDNSTTISFREFTTIDHVTAVGKHNRIESGTVVQDSWATSKYDSAWYLAINRDDISDELEVTKHSVVHNNSSAFISTSINAKTGTNNHVISTADINGGNVRLLGTGSSPQNSTSFYRIGIGDDDSTGYSGEDEAAVVINTDVDSASEVIDSWAHASFRGAKYYISVNNASKTECSNIECSVVHNGTTATVSVYNVVNTGSNDLITLTAAINGSNVELSAAGLEPNLRVHAYTFSTGTYQAAHYIVVATNASEGHSSICEAAVVSDGTNAYISQYGLNSTKGTDQILLTVGHAGSTTTVSATSTSGGSTTVNAYRVNLTRGEGASSASAVLDSVSASTYRSAKYNVQVVDETSGNYEILECNVMHDGSSAYVAEFGNTGSSTGLITITADINSGNLRLIGAINNLNDHVVKVVRRVVKV